MNRLVIIGNGFDLAHGLPTSYGHFIDDFWKSFNANCKNDLYKKIVLTNDAYDGYYKNYSEIRDFKDFKKNLIEYCKDYKYNFYDKNCVAQIGATDIFRVKNDLFLKINDESIYNWVDIENLYYSELKKIIKSDLFLKENITEEFWKKHQLEKVEKLNNEFDDIKKLLEVYLFEKVINKYHFKIEENNSVLKIFFPDKVEEGKMTNYLDEFPVEDETDAKSNMFMLTNEIQNYSDNFQTSMMYKVIFLNFNYTPTSKLYIDEIKKRWQQSEIINIHGEVENSEHPIVFGYGDEMDEDYKVIENFNDNRLLENIKSFQYLNKSNYKRLLDFIKQFGKFQVFILGHSCGLSDRVLLNTIFENENCRSIKVFYHKKNNEKDNYTEIVQNISRHFNDKTLMREKIVNKTFCQPLPQLQLPKIE